MTSILMRTVQRLIAVAFFSIASIALAAGPTIDMWYGDSQSFGAPGTPQKWINILGNASDSSGVQSLTYSLNNSADRPLTLGPNNPRLQYAGDFNIELDAQAVIAGLNSLTITATNGNGETSTKDIQFTYDADSYWPRNYSIDWSTVTDLQDAAQAVDGNWVIEGSTVRTVQTGYDRLLAIGDEAWQNYEIEVPVTINSVDQTAYQPGIGLLLRWPGHHDWDDNFNPNIGWWPMGALGWYRYDSDIGGDILTMIGNEGSRIAVNQSKQLAEGISYIFKARVETPVASEGSWYRMKVWPQGEPEPAAWDMEAQEQITDPQLGSILFVAHHVDASFGSVNITPIDPPNANHPPQISNLSVIRNQDNVRITWDTDKVSNSTVNYGLTTAYGDTITNTNWTLNHSITLPNLEPGTGYHAQVSGTDLYGLSSSSSNIAFTTLAEGELPQGFAQEDEFNGANLDPSWSIIDPQNDGTVTASNGALSIQVPGGISHDVWNNTNTTVRVTQPQSNVDFETEIKFDSVPTEQYQLQGLLVTGTNGELLRFDFYHDGSALRVFSAAIANGASSVQGDAVVSSQTPLYMRVKRSGEQWTQSYSYDGLNWTTSAQFTHAIATSELSLFAGNAGETPPAFTATVDYFHIAPGTLPIEDNQAPSIANLTINTLGNEANITWTTDELATTLLEFGETNAFELGSFSGPESTNHDFTLSGLEVGTTYYLRLTATDGFGNQTIDSSQTFIAQAPQPPAISNISVAPGSTGATITWNTDKLSTSNIQYGYTSVYGESASDIATTTDHSLEVSGLTPESLVHFKVTAVDGNGLSSESADQTFTTLTADGQAASDSFDGTGLDAKWSITDPRGDGTVNINSGIVGLSVPDGVSHDVWSTGTNALQITQPMISGDFEAEVKFTSLPQLQYQLQGLIFSQDNSNFLRFDFYHDGTALNLFAAQFSNGTPTILGNLAITANSPLYMRVQRSGNSWIQSYSDDGQTWNQATSFNTALNTSQVAVFAGNAGNSPAFTALVDHFYIASGALPTNDVYAPTISDISVSSSGSDSTISWQTNESSNSVVRFGQTSAYELGQISDSSYQSQHSATLTGLADGSTYYYEIEVSDQSGNTTASGQQSFVQQVSAAPLISNVTISSSDSQATVSWQTDTASDSMVNWGPDEFYGYSEGDTNLTSNHSVTITGLNPATTYYVAVSSTDSLNQTTTESGFSFDTLSSGGAEVAQTDNFDTPLGSHWSTIDPLGDGSVSVENGNLTLNVPAGSPHDVWTNINNTLQVEQTTNNIDFETEVKFDSSPGSAYQLQGVFIEEDPSNFLRFDFYSDGSGLRVFAASFTNGTPTIAYDNAIPAGAPLYMRVKRTGDFWQQSYSRDGQNWTTAAAFNFSLNVNAIALFAGNAGGNAPAFNGIIDHFLIAEGELPVVDSNPPQISNLQISAYNGDANISWDTNELTDSTVLYGLTSSYELGSVYQANASTSHNALIQGLQNSQTYHYQLQVTDASGNLTTMPDSTFTVNSPSAPAISNVNVVAEEESAVITWQTDIASDSTVTYGEDVNYGMSAYDSTLATQHSVTLTGLQAATSYQLMVSSTSDLNETGQSTNFSFNTASPYTGEAYDYFDSSTLSSDWTLVDPKGDGTVTSANGAITLTVPSGTSHDVWNSVNQVLAIERDVADTDFETEIKFDSAPSQQYQLQGILIKQDANNFIRLDFYHDGTTLNAFAATFSNGAATTIANVPIASNSPIYLRVSRSGNEWTQSYSYDGLNWTQTAGFTYSLSVASISLYAGNAGSNPEFSAVIDHFLFAEGSLPTADTHAPTITNLATLQENNALSVTWNSDEPAIGSVRYGLTDSYELGTLSITDYVSAHDYYVGNLGYGSTYFIEVSATDDAGNTAYQNTTFTLLEPSAPAITGLSISTTESSATISWDTDEPAASRVDFGIDSSYGNSLASFSFSDSHSFTINGLTASNEYFFQLSSTNNSGLTATNESSFTTNSTPEVFTAESDSFDTSEPNSSWTLLDPQGDSAMTVSGGALNLIVASDSSHDVWSSGNDSVRLQQDMSPGDFTAEVKFLSIPSQQYQLQGLLFEQSDGNLLRFDFYSDGADLRVFAATFTGWNPTSRGSMIVNAAAPLYMRVSKQGSQWTQSYSTDGSTWITNVSFTSSIEPNNVSVFAGNAGGSPPAFIAKVDYFSFVDQTQTNNYGPIPIEPTNIYAVSVTPTQVQLNWEPSNDDVGVVGYRIYRDTQYLGTTVTTEFIDESIQESTYYEYSVIAVDTEAQESLPGYASVDTITDDSSQWFDSSWGHRLFLGFNSQTTMRDDAIFEQSINFTAVLTELAVEGTFNPDSILCVELDASGLVINSNVICQFDAAPDFDGNSNAQGVLAFQADGNTAAHTGRYFHVYFDTEGGAVAAAPASNLITITDNVIDEGQESLVIATAAGTYYYQKEAGGFSSYVDADGFDWIGYQSSGSNDEMFRGIPNLVYPEGYFHPGATNTISTLVSSGPLKATIHTITVDGNWEATWEFYPNHATMTVLKAPGSFWFLYEGTPGGSLETNSDYAVLSDGSSYLLSDGWKGDLSGDEWVYFVDPALSRSLFVASHQRDNLTDSYSHLDSNMTVFGFGRDELVSELNTIPAKFSFGLVEFTNFQETSSTINTIIQPLSGFLSSPASQ